MRQSAYDVIVGLGVTGLACARYLQHLGIPFSLFDTRQAPPELETVRQMFPEVPLQLGHWDDAWMMGARRIIVSPGVPLATPELASYIARGKVVMGDIELFAEHVPHVPVIAITGTNAKSTVTTLVGEMAKSIYPDVAVGGNLGVPALDLLLQQPQAAMYILELSSFQLETTHTLKPTVATVLNVTPDHMDRYASLQDYKAAKLRVYRDATWVVCNKDDPATWVKHDQVLYFTQDKPEKNTFGLLQTKDGVFLGYEDQRLMPVSELPVIGKHYQINALASLALGQAVGLPMENMLAVLRTFPGLPHRCQFVRERRDIKWYNDSKGTNVGATQAALLGLGSVIPGKIVLIAGGVGKDADFSTLLPEMQRYVRHVVLIGEAANTIADVVGSALPCSFAASMADAVVECDRHAHAGDAVLLSPACASLDMFKHYGHRGEVFMACVNQLA